MINIPVATADGKSVSEENNDAFLGIFFAENEGGTSGIVERSLISYEWSLDNF
jgi:hypothetical protein